MCAGCRAHEARYGFRDEHDDPTSERPRTLCFECFRVEIGRHAGCVEADAGLAALAGMAGRGELSACHWS